MKLYGILILLAALVFAGCASGGATAKSEVAATTAGPLYAFGFEDGSTGGWHAKGPVNIEVTEKAAHTGKKSLYASARSETWHAPEIQIVELTREAGVYAVSCWVQLAADGPAASVKMTVETAADGAKNWVQIAMPVSAEPGQWVKIAGEFVRKGSLENAGFYIEPLDPTVSFFVDDIEITYKGK